jgi:hypothetical protein
MLEVYPDEDASSCRRFGPQGLETTLFDRALLVVVVFLWSVSLTCILAQYAFQVPYVYRVAGQSIVDVFGETSSCMSRRRPQLAPSSHGAFCCRSRRNRSDLHQCHLLPHPPEGLPQLRKIHRRHASGRRPHRHVWLPLPPGQERAAGEMGNSKVPARKLLKLHLSQRHSTVLVSRGIKRTATCGVLGEVVSLTVMSLWAGCPCCEDFPAELACRSLHGDFQGRRRLGSQGSSCWITRRHAGSGDLMAGTSFVVLRWQVQYGSSRGCM